MSRAGRHAKGRDATMCDVCGLRPAVAFVIGPDAEGVYDIAYEVCAECPTPGVAAEPPGWRERARARQREEEWDADAGATGRVPGADGDDR